jgi:hypothetical protein
LILLQRTVAAVWINRLRRRTNASAGQRHRHESKSEHDSHVEIEAFARRKVKLMRLGSFLPLSAAIAWSLDETAG